MTDYDECMLRQERRGERGEPGAGCAVAILLPTWLLVVLVVELLLVGCGATPYAEVGAGVKLDGTDWYLRAENGGGRDPTAWLAVGVERRLRGRLWGYCEVSHWSHWRDGGPLNARPEAHKNEARCAARWRWGEP